MNYALPLVVLLMLFAAVSNSQQLPVFTQYNAYQSYINPAHVNKSFLLNDYQASVSASYRKQWLKQKSGPVSQLISASFINPKMDGIFPMFGVDIINDATGPISFTGAYLRGGAIISPDPEYSGLVGAISVGGVNYRIDSDKLRFREEGDPIGLQNTSIFYPDVSVGVYGYGTLDGGFFDDDIIYGGVSVPQLIGLDLELDSDNKVYHTMRVQHYYSSVGILKNVKNNGVFDISASAKYIANAPLNLDFQFDYYYNDNFWLGVGWTTSSIMQVKAGLIMGPNIGWDYMLKLGYSFDYSFNNIGPDFGSVHEFGISFSFLEY